ncbi:MAG: hypothetical protein H7338_02375 [Candidatus Sericytochromatia bacterium]|nr:hypothetical protein [Candidatus Sericytochromatia bacterium]
MWAEATFQVDLRVAGALADADVDRLRGYPGIALVSPDTGRQLIVVSFDPAAWSTESLVSFLERLVVPWVLVRLPLALPKAA